MDASMLLSPAVGAPQYDEMLVDFLMENPCLWDKSNQGFRNRVMKEYKWKEIADRIHMASHEANRRYKTLCERFRRETIKQQSIPNYVSSWPLFDKFATLKDAQASDLKIARKHQKKQQQQQQQQQKHATIKIKTEELDDDEALHFSAILAAAAAAAASSNDSIATNDTISAAPERRSDEMDYTNDNNDTANSDLDSSDNNTNDEREGSSRSGLCVEPTCIGGSTDLSTDTIAAFCQFLEANLKQFNTDQSDELIEDIANLLFRKKKEFKMNPEASERGATMPTTTTTTTTTLPPS